MSTTDDMEDAKTPVQQVYSSCTIFVTGATGFLGKALLQKLVRTFPDISSIYVLVRDKKGKSMDKRMEDLYEDPVFDKMKQEVPKFRQIVSAVNGDCSLPNLGLSPEDQQKLIREVDIIFHGAATVRFDETLKLAVTINVCGTRDLLNMARQMPKLKAFVHVSTAFSHCYLSDIDEKFYKLPTSYEKVINIVNSCNDDILQTITPAILNNYPNTYVFTKALAEEVIEEESKGLPVTIFRPAIVVSTKSDPVCGWIDNIYGPTGVLLGAGIGLLRTLNCDEDCVANLVPVDMVVNAMIAAAWDVASKKADRPVPIYNYVSSCDRPLKWKEFQQLAILHGTKIPSDHCIWYYSFRLTRSRALYLLQLLFLHFLPALIIDTAMVIARSKPRFLKAYKKIHRFSDVITYFNTRDWNFSNSNVKGLWQQMSKEDRSLLDFDISELDWNHFFNYYVKGMRIYLLKDDLSTVPQATVRYRRLYWAHQGVKLVLACLALKLVWPIVTYFLPLLST